MRKARELQLRDLGGLIFDMYRFGSKRQDLVSEKLQTLFQSDAELEELERMLEDPRRLHDLREPGVGGTCRRCGTLYSSEARYCATCGAPMQPAAQATDRPITPPPTRAPAPADGTGSSADGLSPPDTGEPSTTTLEAGDPLSARLRERPR